MKIKVYGKLELVIKMNHQYWGFLNRLFNKNYNEQLDISLLSIPYTKRYDEIEITETKNNKFTFKTNSEIIKNKPYNNILKTVEYFFTNNPSLKQTIKLTLTKNVSEGSGLSYGASSAIATFKLLHDFYNLKYTELHILKFAAVIGPDAFFFIYNKPCWINKKTNNLNFDVKLSEAFLDKLKVDFNSELKIDLSKIKNEVSTEQLFLQNYKYYIKNVKKYYNNKYYNVLEQATFDTNPKLYSVYKQLIKKYDFVILCGIGTSFIYC